MGNKKKKKKFKPTRVRDGTRVDKKETHEQVPLNQLKASATATWITCGSFEYLNTIVHHHWGFKHDTTNEMLTCLDSQYKESYFQLVFQRHVVIPSLLSTDFYKDDIFMALSVKARFFMGILCNNFK